MGLEQWETIFVLLLVPGLGLICLARALEKGFNAICPDGLERKQRRTLRRKLDGAARK